MYKTHSTAIFLDLLFRRQLDRAPANSHASRVQATPPPCPLCSQKVQNCLPKYLLYVAESGYHAYRKNAVFKVMSPLLIVYAIEGGNPVFSLILGCYHYGSLAKI